MNGRPSAAQLLEAVAAFQAQSPSAAEQGANAYLAKVAANLQQIVQRQARLGPAAETAERERLQRLLASDETRLPALNQRLCERIATGEMGLHTPGLIDHLWRTTLDQMAVDQPRYVSDYHSTYQSPHPKD